MSSMSDQPLSLAQLAEFCRKVIATELRVLVQGQERILSGLDQRLDRIEAGQRDLVFAVHRLDERLSRVEKRVDELAATEPRYALRSEVLELRSSLERVQAQLDTLERRLKS